MASNVQNLRWTKRLVIESICQHRSCWTQQGNFDIPPFLWKWMTYWNIMFSKSNQKIFNLKSLFVTLLAITLTIVRKLSDIDHTRSKLQTVDLLSFINLFNLGVLFPWIIVLYILAVFLIVGGIIQDLILEFNSFDIKFWKTTFFQVLSCYVCIE